MAAPRRRGWRRITFIVIVVIVLPLWVSGMWAEHQTEKSGREITGRIVGGDRQPVRRPRFDIEFPAGGVVHRKNFSVTAGMVARATGGTGDFINPDVLLRVHPEYPDAARLAESTPLPWWGGLIGMSVVFTVLGFTMWPERR
jgi:hypothetical protein